VTDMPERIWARQMATGWRGAIGTWNVCEFDAGERAQFIRDDIAAEDRAAARVDALRYAAEICLNMNGGWCSDDHMACANAILALIDQEGAP